MPRSISTVPLENGTSRSAAASIRSFDDREALARAVAADIAAAVQASAESVFSLALTGGQTVLPVYEVLGGQYPPGLWSRVHFCWSDERIVRREETESNYRAASEVWLRPAGIPPERVHHPDVTLDDPHEVARCYERQIRALLGPRLALDCALLSLGEDGHIASLFPGRAETREGSRLVVGLDDSPKAPSRRVTFTLPLITRARQIHVLATGANKADALNLILGRRWDPRDPSFPPAAALVEAPGQVEWWVDRAAMARLPPS